MSYIVRWLKEGVVVAERRYDDLVDAKQSAKSQLPVWDRRKGATSAIVTDDSGVLYMQVW